MISYLKGKIISKGLNYAVLEANGIGFKVFMPERDLNKLSRGIQTELYTSLEIKRDGFELYGFCEESGLELFETLSSISGFGPKASLKVASLGTLDDLRQAIESNDEGFFAQIKGVGTKKIQKVILELSGKISSLKAGQKAFSPEEKKIIDTLVSLGFEAKDAGELVKNIPKEVEGIKDKVKWCLKNIGK